MPIIRRLWRLSALFIHLLIGVVLALVLTGILRKTYQHDVFKRAKQWWLKRLASITGAEVIISGEPLLQRVLWVANHVSWLDIGVVGGVGVPRFLSKIEVKKWPIVGWLATQAGTLYIDRGQSGETAAEAVRQALLQGDRVALFPEGTTTDGKNVKHFFARIFAPALDTETPVQPVVLRYTDQQGAALESVPYVGQQNLLINLWRVTGLPRFKAHIQFLPPIATAGLNRKEVATQCEELIRAELLANHSSDLVKD
ncbi:MAG: lysophospholipid acyltransferase family protein [Thiofilum sp.]|uniref:lysophospholipid acyltransferase family protein n=1 Tax=Thiofilum sp. TaxID=2212733 RepID=UPI0025F6DCCA|nr:lysophospholipid acyltransferase family protein [Thiofilum sp.]MBK8453883.1 1-acyl-sn-glycerol-3-phosphate acyltransferase [Thiofilum sp.]